MSNTEKKDSRVRNWSIVVYPDSAPSEWRSIIDEWHIEWIESPLHDKDVNADGTPKKPHWHILLMFGGVKSYEQVLDMIQPLNCPIPCRVHNAKALVRYMAHLDNPEKHQYKTDDIIGHGGVDISGVLKPNSSERYTYIKEMQSWCNDNNVVEFQHLFNYAANNRFDDWYPLLCDSCAFVMNMFLKSKRHSGSSPNNTQMYVVEDGNIVDTETGDIIGKALEQTKKG